MSGFKDLERLDLGFNSLNSLEVLIHPYDNFFFFVLSLEIDVSLPKFSESFMFLQGLKLCVNLKWLSVVQNKLHSLKGIEGLTKLTVSSDSRAVLSDCLHCRVLDLIKSYFSLMF